MGDKVYFQSDRTMVLNLYSYDLNTKQVEQITKYTDYDVKSLSSFANTVVFEQDGRIHLLDVSTGSITSPKINLGADVPYKRPRYEDMSDHIRDFNISATGVRALFNSRGDIFSVPREKGDARNISSSPGSHERFPEWSPDGKMDLLRFGCQRSLPAGSA